MTRFETENDLRLTIKAEEKEILVDEVCCTSVNIILKNDGQIMTSFLGAHNPEIIKNLEKSLKLYFKGIKKTLKQKYNEEDCCCGDEHCHGECHDHECECGDNCDCHEENADCKCKDHHGHCDCNHSHEEKDDVKEVKKPSKKTSTNNGNSKKSKSSKTK